MRTGIPHIHTHTHTLLWIVKKTWFKQLKKQQVMCRFCSFPLLSDLTSFPMFLAQNPPSRTTEGGRRAWCRPRSGRWWCPPPWKRSACSASGSRWKCIDGRRERRELQLKLCLVQEKKGLLIFTCGRIVWSVGNHGHCFLNGCQWIKLFF